MLKCRRCKSQVFGTPYLCPNCGEFIPESLIGKVLSNKYELLGILGAGGMGAVYRAARTHIGDEVAVKILNPNLAHEAGRFRREMTAAARVQHRNIIEIYDWGEAHETSPAFIVMETVRGVSLSDLITQEEHLDPWRAVSLMSEICRGVGVAHQAGVWHRDLKPANIMVLKAQDENDRETVKVLDFGLAKLSDPTATKYTHTGQIMGTPLYMSPEQCRGEEVDARTDIYSLGVIFYEMLTGLPPFSGNNFNSLSYKHQYEQPSPFPSRLNVPPELESLTMRVLSKELDERPSNAIIFLNELNQYLKACPKPRRKAKGATPAMAAIIVSPRLPTFEFHTVTLNASGHVKERRKGRAHYLEKIGTGRNAGNGRNFPAELS
jgi:eukaryotic-like serine/threonine-protein kinase